jgi:phage terminase small subunit
MKSKDHTTDRLASRTEIEEVLLGDATLSKEMRALTPKQRAFVLALVELGGATDESHRAAAIAGYTGSKGVLQVTASRLAADDRVQHALVEEAKRMAKTASLEAVCNTIQIMRDPLATANARLNAAARVMTIAGMDPAQKIDVTKTIEVTLTRKQQIEQIHSLAAEIGIDPRKLLGQAGVTQDAEFEIIGDTTGLEDIL